MATKNEEHSMDNSNEFQADCKNAEPERAGFNEKVQESKSATEDEVRLSGLLYGLDDIPPWYLTIFLGIQQCFLALGGLMGVPFILANALCLGDTDTGYLGKAMILNTLFFISGISTMLQVTIGNRLPILQGGSFSYIPPALAILALPHNQCPNDPINVNGAILYNDTDGELIDEAEVWMRRMREVQGAVAVAAIVEIVLGMTGAMGFLTRFIGPLTVAPAIALLGLTLFDAASYNASGHWGIAFFTMAALVVFSQYLRNTLMPLPWFSKDKRWHLVQSNFIKLFPVLITISVAWIFCAILTAAGGLPQDSAETGYRARTDVRVNVMKSSPWFRFPYPGQWGTPIVSVSGVVGMIAGVLSSIIESIGDYYACARLSGAPPVPQHALNRGIAIEGVGSVVSGVLGTGAGVTSYSENIGAIAITRVASRRVIQVAGVFLLIAGMIGKFGAILVLIPDPVIGGMFCVMFGMVASVGLSNLQHVNLNSSRNLFIVGYSLFMGIMVPVWVRGNESSINTGVAELDRIIIVLLETSIFIGGALAAFFDNTIPGTLEERGMIGWSKIMEEKQDQKSGVDGGRLQSIKSYDLPFSISWRFTKYVPFLPKPDQSMKNNREGP